MEEEQTTGIEQGSEGNEGIEQEQQETEPIEQEPVEQDPTEGQEIQEEIPVDDGSYNEFYSEQLELTNHLLAGQIFFLGVIFGVLLFKVFWDRWKV